MNKVAEEKTTTQTVKNRSTPPTNELTLGVIVDVDDVGTPLINYPNNTVSSPMPALSTVPVGKDAIGRQVAVMFAAGDFQQPVVIGLIRNALDAHEDRKQHVDQMEADFSNELSTSNQSVDVKVDDERLVLSAKKEIVLQCGESSITLTKAGKVLIRGTYLLNRSSGVNCIKGAAVQIN